MEYFGYLILVSMCLIVSTGTIGLILGGKIRPYMFAVSLILDFVWCSLLFRYRLQFKTRIIVFVLFVAMYVLIMSVCGRTYTVDYDGNAYHKMAAGYLKNGWNPLKESADTFADSFWNDEDLPETGMWLDHYGKSSWIFASVIYAVSGNIESGKMYQILGMLMGICLWYPYLRRRQSGNMKSWLVTFAVVLNPVSVVQMLTYYVDGFLFSLLYLLILGLIKLLDEREDKISVWCLIYSSMLLLSNVKFTGLFYGGVYCAAFFCIYLSVNCKKSAMQQCIKVFQKFFLLAVLCICVIGFPVYIKNYIDHGTLTYPLTGSSSVDIMTPMSPRGFEGKNSFYKLFYSLFGRLGNILHSSEQTLPVLKIPLSVHKEELEFLSCDMRISGFGLFFSGLLCIAVIVIAVYLIKEKNKTMEKMILTILTVISVLLTLGISETWWARYAPYLYTWIPAAVYLLLREKGLADQWKKALNAAAAAFILLLAANNLYFGLLPVRMISESIKINREFEQIEGSIVISFPDMNLQGQRFNLSDHGIEYTVSDQGQEKNLYQMYYTQDQ